MKKIIAMLLAVLLACSGVALASQVPGKKDLSTDTNLVPAVTATPAPEKEDNTNETYTEEGAPLRTKEETAGAMVFVEGFLLEKGEAYLLLATNDGQQLQVNLTEDAALLAEDIVVGDYMYVVHNGMLTRSIPAQVGAITLGCDKLSGVVEELSEEGFMLRVETAVEGEADEEPEVTVESYFVLADMAALEGIQVDMPVTVFHDGQVTRSVPAQVTAQFVRLMELEGVVDETTEEGFLMTDVNGMQYRVALTEDARLFVEPVAGTAVRVVYNGVATMSIPALINGTEVLPVPVAEGELATVTIID